MDQQKIQEDGDLQNLDVDPLAGVDGAVDEPKVNKIPQPKPSSTITEKQLIYKTNFNSKIFKKKIKNRMEFYRVKCRMKVGCWDSEYRSLSHKMISALSDNLNCDLVYEKNSVYTLMHILEFHFSFLKQVEVRVKNLSFTANTKLFNEAHSLVMTKQKEMIEMLKQNVRKPMSFSEFQRLTQEYKASQIEKEEKMKEGNIKRSGSSPEPIKSKPNGQKEATKDKEVNLTTKE